MSLILKFSQKSASCLPPVLPLSFSRLHSENLQGKSLLLRVRLWDCLCWCLFSSSVQKPYDCVGVKFAVYSYGTVREALLYLQLPCRRGMCSLIGAPLNCDHNVMFVCFRQNVLPQASCWRRRPAVASWMFFLLLFVSIMSRRLWIFIFVCLWAASRCLRRSALGGEVESFWSPDLCSRLRFCDHSEFCFSSHPPPSPCSRLPLLLFI